MAFVYQELTQEDKKYIESFKIPYQYGGGHSLTFARAKAPIDRERNIFLHYAGGLGEVQFKDEKPAAVYYLIWDGDLIKFAFFMDDRKRDENNKTIYEFDIYTICAPKKFESIEEELIIAVKESIIEFYRGLDTKYFGRVESILTGKPLFTDMDIRKKGV